VQSGKVSEIWDIFPEETPAFQDQAFQLLEPANQRQAFQLLEPANQRQGSVAECLSSMSLVA